MVDEELEELIERKVKEVVEEKIDENEVIGDRDEIAEKVKENLDSPRRQQVERLGPGLPRRRFLKMLGLGAGSIALASGASGAWGRLRASSQGVSDIDADEVDGYMFSVGSSKPGSPATGTIFYDTDGEGVHYYNGSSWVEIAATSLAGTVIDDFTDNDLSEYSSINGSAWSANNQMAVEDHPNSTQNVAIYSNSGLNRYPKAGENFQYRFRITNNAFSHNYPELELWWGVQGAQSNNDGDDCYQVRFTDNNTWTLHKRSNGNWSTLGSGTQSISSDTWYRLYVNWGSGGTMSIELRDDNESSLTSFSGSDTDYSDGGIGFSANTNGAGSGDGDAGEYHIDWVKFA